MAAEKERQEEAMWAKINGWLADHRKVSRGRGTIPVKQSPFVPYVQDSPNPSNLA